MSETSSPAATPAPSTPATTPAPEATSEVQALRALVLKLQSALIALTWIVGVFIFIQFWRARSELNAIRPQAAPIVDAAKRTQPVIDQFLTQLVDYARANPDIQPLLAKYPIQIAPAPTAPTTAPTAPKPTTAPAPATPKK